jgi:hypothetical protein
MSIIPVEELKAKFSSGKYPKENDYEDLIETLSDNSGLVTSISVASPITNSGTAEEPVIGADLSEYYTSEETDFEIAATAALKADASHSHSISDITGLQTDLDAKASTGKAIAMAIVFG